MSYLTSKCKAPTYKNVLDDFFGLSINSDHIDVPKTNIYENDKEIGVQVALPGYEKNNIEVNVKENILTVEGTRDIAKENLKSQEFGGKKAKRSYRLGSDIDENSIKAEYIKGILNLTFQKKAEAVPKKIEIV